MRNESLAIRLGRAVLDDLHAQHGDAFHLIDLDRARSNIRALLASFRKIYPETRLAHSYKTNYLPALCRLTHAEGAYAEVVSGVEFDLALRLAIPPERIILNGPVKSRKLLERSLLRGSLVNIDAMEEAREVLRIAEAHPATGVRVGLRCNFPLPGLRRSRFGLDAGSGDLAEAASIVRGAGNLRLEGLHGHFGGDRSTDSYRLRTERMIALSDQIFGGVAPRWLNVGGGLAGPMPPNLRAQFKTPPPTYSDYAQAIAAPMRERYGTGRDAPALVLEPGIGLFADVMELVCRVHAIKRIGEVHHAVVTGSIYNAKPTLNSFDLAVEAVPLQRPAGERRRYVVSGLTCMEIDVLHSGLEADLAVGDDLVFQNTGAYTIVLKPPFIEAAPAIVSHDQGVLSTARRAETLDDILVTYPLSGRAS